MLEVVENVHTTFDYFPIAKLSKSNIHPKHIKQIKVFGFYYKGMKIWHLEFCFGPSIRRVNWSKHVVVAKRKLDQNR